jgi:uncharacterized membrane protein
MAGMNLPTTRSREVDSRIPRRRWDDSGINVGDTERILSAIAGVALLAVGLRRPRVRRLLWPIGGSLIGRAVTGRSTVNYVLGRNSAQPRRTSPVASLEAGSGTRIERSVIVARPADELYHFWRDFTNLPRFMDNLEAVRVLDEDRSHWVAKGPAGMRVEWDATIHNEIEGELIAWRSLPGADVDQAGSVHFVPAGDGMTEVRVVLRYRPRGGKVGDSLARLLGDDPDQQVGDDLRRFKQVVEAV